MNVGITELLLVAVIVFLLFGTKKLRGIGSDLGTAIRDFKSAMKENNTQITTTSSERDKE